MQATFTHGNNEYDRTEEQATFDTMHNGIIAKHPFGGWIWVLYATPNIGSGRTIIAKGTCPLKSQAKAALLAEADKAMHDPVYRAMLTIRREVENYFSGNGDALTFASIETVLAFARKAETA